MLRGVQCLLSSRAGQCSLDHLRGMSNGQAHRVGVGNSNGDAFPVFATPSISSTGRAQQIHPACGKVTGNARGAPWRAEVLPAMLQGATRLHSKHRIWVSFDARTDLSNIRNVNTEHRHADFFIRAGPGAVLAAGAEAGRNGAVGTPNKAAPSRCPPTETPPSWAGMAIIETSGRRGSTRARQCLEPAGGEAGRHWRGRSSLSRLLRRGVRRRQYRHRGRVSRQRGEMGQRGFSPATLGYGLSKAASSSALTGREKPFKATPLRCPPTATPPSWVDMATTVAMGLRGSSPVAVGVVPARQQTGRHRSAWRRRWLRRCTRLLGRAVGQR